VATLVTFHAHPDDESTATAGTMAKAAAAGHRVVLVSATNGEHGEPVPGVLAEGEPLWRRRLQEIEVSAAALGVERVELLGYHDSGMMGEPTNDDPACFWQADVEEAATRLAAILTDVGADVLTIYDDHGGYGHPDHIQVHRVGSRAAKLAGVTRVFEATMNRDLIARLLAQANLDPSEGEGDGNAEDFAARQAVAESPTFGSPEAIITHRIDVADHLAQKRASMEAHASQIAPDSFFLAMPAEAYAGAFGAEWYIEQGRVRPAGEDFADDLFADLRRPGS
jgi:LmbE family N-acetylglucosaminyl deacetylase